ncbi:MAG: YoaK family protein [Pseudolabrys sp.]
MKKIGGPGAIAGLLSFNGGFVDTAGFLGLQGLFTAHVTGNFVTLGAALVLGHHGVIGKLLALPEFVLVIALARVAGAGLRARKLPVLRILLTAEFALLTAYFAAAVGFGPFPDPDSPLALLTGFAGIAAMALQNGLQRVHLASAPPTTIMTGNTTQATIDAVDLLIAPEPAKTAETRARFVRVALSIVYFAAGCAIAATLYWLVGFWCLGLAVAVGAAAAVMRLEAGA